MMQPLRSMLHGLADAGGSGPLGRMYRATAIIAVVTGLGLIAAAPALSLFDRMAATERITDRVRPLITGPGLVAFRDNVELLDRGNAELTGSALPRFARELRTSPQELERVVATQFPALARGAAQIPDAAAALRKTTIGLTAREDKFERAESLPALGLPLTAIPWIFVGLGVGLAVAGVAALRSGARSPLRAILLVGLAMCVGTVAISAPDKAADSADLIDFGAPRLSQQNADKAQRTIAFATAMFDQLEGELLPSVARQLGLTPGQLRASIAREEPALATLLRESDAAIAVGQALSDANRASVADFRKTDKLELQALPWILIGPGALVAALAAAGLAGAPRLSAPRPPPAQ